MTQVVTLRLKLRQPTVRKTERLLLQQEYFSQACSFFVSESERLGTTSIGKLQRACYQAARASFNLSPGVIQTAMMKAIATRRAVLARRLKGKPANEPIFRNVPVGYRNDLYQVISIGEGFGLRLPTASGRARMSFPVEIGEFQRRYLSLLASGCAKQGTGELFRTRTGTWYFHLALTIPRDLVEPSAVIGVDLGVVKLATVATPDGLLNRFHNGRFIRFRRERRKEVRAQLYAHGRRARVKRMKGKETRWMTYHNHVVSKRIVQEAKFRNAAIILEDLKGIRERAKSGKRGKRMIASWAFRQLTDFISYKANLEGVQVCFVNPRGTSRKCSRCECEDKRNRKSQASYACRSCGFRINADLNAARNIAKIGSMALGHAPKANGSMTPRMAQDQGNLAQANLSAS